jgi:spermidine synthase
MVSNKLSELASYYSTSTKLFYTGRITVSPAPMSRSHLPAPVAPLVTTRDGVRTLEFRAGAVQSAMRVDRPHQLLLAYVRAMMCFVLFVPRPRHILMVGLGGGSLLKFCYRHFPQARISVVELRADVIALREQFCVPPDDERLTVIHGDALDLVASMRNSVDVLMVDGFDEVGLPPALGSAKFYADCRRALRRNGVLVANVFSYDVHYPRMLHRLRLIFNERLCYLDGVAGNNRILFALNLPFRLEPGEQEPRAARLQRALARRNGLGWRWLNRLLVRTVVAWIGRR